MPIYANPAPAIMMASAIRARNTASEAETFIHAKLTIEELVKNGADVYHWNVETKVDGLPETKRWDGPIKDKLYQITHFGYRPAHKMKGESNEEYLRSVFGIANSRAWQMPEYFEGRNILAVMLDQICLLFNTGETVVASEKGMWKFFYPQYHSQKAYNLERETQIRKHTVWLKYDHFEESLPSGLAQINTHGLVRIRRYEVGFS